MISSKAAALTVAVCAVAGYLCLPLAPRAPERRVGGAEPIQIDIWQPWGGSVGEGFLRVVDRFNAIHPDIHAHAVYSASYSSNSTKLFISVAAGVPPDLSFVDGSQVAAWAELGLLNPLDDFIAQAGISADNYWPPCWRQCAYRGHAWAITIGADPNFALAWNKRMFREVGLDPEAPPHTIDEVDAVCERFAKFDAQGNLVRVGMMPWLPYGGANMVTTWGWIFGGSFFDPAENRVTADDPRNVAALEWLGRSANRFGFARLNAFNSTFGSGTQDPFFTGRVAMEAMHITLLQEIPAYAPDLDFGLAPLPAPPGGEYGASWVGGWTLVVPRDVRARRMAARQAAALTFLKWACASDDGTAFIAKNMQLLPGYKPCPYFAEIRAAEPGSYEAKFLAPFLRILETTKHQQPTMAAEAKYSDELERAYGRTLYGQSTAAAALADARVQTQRTLDAMLARRAKRNAVAP